jgi:hypothetical protein
VPTDPPPTKAPIVEPTEVVLEEQPTTPPEAIVQTYFDDFSSDQGNWEVFSSDFGSAAIADNVMLLGPFNDCGETDNSGPFGCFSQCLWCGTLVDYDITVDAAYISGDQSQPFGMVVRFQDQNGNGLVDPEDYYLDFEISTADQYFAVYQHLPGEGWSTLDERQDPNIKVDEINTLRAYAYDGGTKIDLYLNGNLVENVSVNPDSVYGTIGLVTGFAGMQAGFDNFSITLPPPAADISGQYDIQGTNPDGSTYTGQATIALSANGFDIVWAYGNGEQVGSGRLSDRLFSTRFYTQGSEVKGSATYFLEDDGSLTGKWRIDGETDFGSETLTRTN